MPGPTTDEHPTGTHDVPVSAATSTMPAWAWSLVQAIGYAAVGVGAGFGGAYTATPADAADVAALEQRLNTRLDGVEAKLSSVESSFQNLRAAIAASTGQDPERPPQ